MPIQISAGYCIPPFSFFHQNWIYTLRLHILTGDIYSLSRPSLLPPAREIVETTLEFPSEKEIRHI